jgi:hypothetical protein
VTLLKKPFPVDDAFKQLFPTLLSKEMPFIELSLNSEGGEILKTERPLRVCNMID